MFADYSPLLKQKAAAILGLELTDGQLSQFCKFGELLLDWNERMNLTSITDPEEVVIKHFLDSLVFIRWLKLYYPSLDLKLADVGTGAGFPGIPLKLVLPGLRIVLIDSLGKRITFLQEVISELKLAGIETYLARAEDVGQDKKYRETFDAALARAVAELPVLLEYTVPLLKVGGRLFAAKGVQPEDEVVRSRNALEILNCEVEQIDRYSLGSGADNRSLIVVRKNAPTPKKYPRKAGKPKKNPL